MLGYYVDTLCMQKSEVSANPFLKGKVSQPSKSESCLGQQGHISEAIKAVCKPTLVTHDLWKNDSVIDITATGMDVLVSLICALDFSCGVLVGKPDWRAM